MPVLDCEIGFELRGVTRKDNATGVGVEAGETLLVWFAGVDTPLAVTVTKATVVDGRKQITFMTPLIMTIEKQDA